MYISYLLGVFVFLKSNSVVINQFSYEKQGCIFLNLRVLLFTNNSDLFEEAFFYVK